ncbi:hypothetical protein [Natrialba sp. PRR66]|uniref:hypothetical protein n=1 Tax=Natrialba sp. PRR66 TaxID=3098146 RepID=UPI002B1D14A5|nr:hypothetical protein [Natrialba sp. PRR66]
MDSVSQIRLVQADGTPFAGETVAEARHDTERGWIVVSVSHNGTVHTDEHTNITADDVFVAGSDEAIQESKRTVANS